MSNSIRGVWLSALVDGDASPEAGIRAGMGVIRVKLEMPIKCPSEDVRWAVVCAQPKLGARYWQETENWIHQLRN